ncbi:MAG TPA: NUDIX hydrolase [Mycobacteriales bacterium]|nr:NUDIX hydrolase [Mycobacteriales bacterium]
MPGAESTALPPAGEPSPSRRPHGLPPEFFDRARKLAQGELVAVEPRHAATVVLLRDTSSGIRAYLLRRAGSMAFAPRMHVFPGGSVDPRDAQIGDAAWIGPRPATWTTVLTADDGLARALVAAAVRETFEESGVLLAGPAADRVVEDTTGEGWEADRLALLDRSLSLADLLHRRGLALRADLLRPWAHWITPEPEPRRYDTRFFVAALPAGQRTRDVSTESDRVIWVSPAEALERHAAGELAMLPPTVVTLAELAGFADVAAVIRAGDARDVRPILPRVVISDADEARLLLPHEEGYPATDPAPDAAPHPPRYDVSAP